MTDSNAIFAWIRENCLGNDADRELTADMPLLEGALDSLQIVQMVSFLEAEYNVGIDIEEMVPENFETVDRIVAMVERLRQARTA